MKKYKCRAEKTGTLDQYFAMDTEKKLMSIVSFPWSEYYEALNTVRYKMWKDSKHYIMCIPYLNYYLSFTFIRLEYDGRIYLNDMEKLNY